MTTSRFRSPISASMATTLWPRAARAALKFAVVVVLPTPPLPEVIVMTVALISLFLILTVPWFSHNLSFLDGSDLRAQLMPIVTGRGAGNVIANPQLHRRKLQGADHGALPVCVGRARLNQAP